MWDEHAEEKDWGMNKTLYVNFPLRSLLMYYVKVNIAADNFSSCILHLHIMTV